MAGNAWKWFLGCGAGCVVLVLIGAGLIGGGAFLIRGVVREARHVDETMGQVTERFGKAGDFRPQADGAIPAVRVETFLRVRERMAPTRTEMENDLLLLSGEEAPDGREIRRGAFAKLRAGLGIVPQIIGFVNARAEAELEAGMGPGEYLFLYTLAFYDLIGASPADGPPFQLVGDSEEAPDWSSGSADRDEEKLRRWVVEKTTRSDRQAVREHREARIRQALNQTLLPVLRNQLADARETADAAWVASLEAEVAAMEADDSRLPWQEGLPPVIEASLARFRNQLEASYSPLCNPLETGPGRGE